MKSILTISTLLFTMMLSSTSFAEWTKVGRSVEGNTHYLDFERIRKVDGYVYYWDLIDLLKPDKDGDLSVAGYHQGDCKLFRFKYLSVSFYKEPMGGGTGETSTYNNDEWIYPRPNATSEGKLKQVCNW